MESISFFKVTAAGAAARVVVGAAAFFAAGAAALLAEGAEVDLLTAGATFLAGLV
jgi:hypothetical protein